MLRENLSCAAVSVVLTLLASILSSAAQGGQDSYTIAAVGDMMLGTNYPADNLPEGDGAAVLQEAASILSSATVATGNLEGTLLDEGGTPKRCADPSSCHVFRMPERYARLLSSAGIDHVSVANNHSGDFGPAGRLSSHRALGEAGVASTGVSGLSETAVITRDGVRYGFVSFSISTGTLSVNDYVKAAKVVGGLASVSDIVVVNMHIGAEGARHDHVTKKKESYLGEDRGNPYEFSRVVIDAGADVVIGHGPHVPRAVDLYKGRFIAYSLGNFATTTGVSISGKSGYAPLIEVRTDGRGAFLGGRIHSYKQSGPGGNRRPRYDRANACVEDIKRLTTEDGLGAGLRIGDDGTIAIEPSIR